MNYENTNNYVFLQGYVENEPVFDHTVKLNHDKSENQAVEESFYAFNLIVSRLSEEKDIIPVIVSEKFIKDVKIGKLAMRGQFRSYNENINGKSKLNLFMFCQEICEWDENANPNYIKLNGFVCKPTIFRTTPLNREICDIHLAVNRNYAKSDYIPCIAWGANAKFASNFKVGDLITLVGRIQSREYKKVIDGKETVKFAREVSISDLAMLHKDELEKIDAI